MTSAPTQLDNEFSLVAAAAPGTTQARVRRSWVNVATGGHVSGIHWGGQGARVVFLHDFARSARSFDRVALALGQPSVAIDLPGHGRSNWRSDGRYSPRRLAAAVAEAARSFAPQAELLVGAGLGGQVAVAIAARQLLPSIRQLALVDPLPGLTSTPAPDRPEAGPTAGSPALRFASLTDAAEALRPRHPAWPQQEIDKEVATELDQEADGSWAWRHHPGNLPATEAVDAHDPALWDALADLTVPVYALLGSPPATAGAADALGVQFITVAGADGDPVAVAPTALAANIDGLLPAKP
jgi:pimeloyl-ACP methyl ester carboxylesterase